jgi:two-component system sensor histidine kinase HydH
MAPGGRLTLRAGWCEGGTALGTARRGGAPRRLQVEIEDTGAGIGAAEADKVFNPFFTTKSSGTGLGLALAHKIIENHGGSITFRSTPGVGTTFRVVLPLQAERAGGSADG